MARRHLDRHEHRHAQEEPLKSPDRGRPSPRGGATRQNPGMATTQARRDLGGTSDWRKELYERVPEREGELFSTISGLENEPLYTPETAPVDYERDLGYPGRSEEHT